MAEPARTTRREKVEAREQAILAAARRVFEEKGYDGARMADIARAIGAADGTLYTYFPNKEALLRAVLDEFWAELLAGARASVAGAEDVWARLAALADWHIRVCLDNFDFIELSLIAFAPRTRDRATRAHMRGYVQVFDEIWRAGVDCGAVDAAAELWIVRDQFYGALEYSARTLLVRGGGDPAPAVAALVDMLRRGHGRAAPAPDRLAALEARLDALAAPVVRPGRRLSVSGRMSRWPPRPGVSAVLDPPKPVRLS